MVCGTSLLLAFKLASFTKRCEVAGGLSTGVDAVWLYLVRISFPERVIRIRYSCPA
jgi:hypothetical protein